MQEIELSPVNRIVSTLSDVAYEFEVATGTAERWRKDGMPGRPDHWDLYEIADWLNERMERTGRGKRYTVESGIEKRDDFKVAQIMELELEACLKRLPNIDSVIAHVKAAMHDLNCGIVHSVARLVHSLEGKNEAQRLKILVKETKWLLSQVQSNFPGYDEDRAAASRREMDERFGVPHSPTARKARRTRTATAPAKCVPEEE